MASIVIRNLEKTVVDRIDEMAMRKGMSREEYIRNLLRRHAASPEVNAVEERYDTLFSKLMELQGMILEQMDDSNEVMRRVVERL